MARSIGSDASLGQMRDAKNTALGRRTTGSLRVSRTPSSSVGRAGSRARGSWEGLDRSSSTQIQMAGRGYLAEGAQKARGAAAPTDLTMSHLKSFNGIIKPGTMRNTTHIATGGSTAKLAKIMQLNKFF